MTDYLTPPAWLDRRGNQYWRRLAPALAMLGKLDAVSYDLLAAGSKAYSTYRAAVELLDKEGRVLTAPSGVKRVHPASTVEKQAFEMLCRVFKELQLGDKPPVSPSSELDEFLRLGKD